MQWDHCSILRRMMELHGLVSKQWETLTSNEEGETLFAFALTEAGGKTFVNQKHGRGKYKDNHIERNNKRKEVGMGRRMGEANLPVA